jgi:hypothetical protein
VVILATTSHKLSKFTASNGVINSFITAGASGLARGIAQSKADGCAVDGPLGAFAADAKLYSQPARELGPTGVPGHLGIAKRWPTSPSGPAPAPPPGPPPEPLAAAATAARSQALWPEASAGDMGGGGLAAGTNPDEANRHGSTSPVPSRTMTPGALASDATLPSPPSTAPKPWTL